MTGLMQPGRRRVLCIGGAGLVLTVLGDSPMARATPAARVMNSFSDPWAAETLGRAYLAAHPWDRDIRVLVQGLVETSAGWVPLLYRGTPQAIRRFTKKQCRRDFIHNRVALVDGWLLATTEARLCALAALGRMS